MTFRKPFGTGTTGRVRSAWATDLVLNFEIDAGALISTRLIKSKPLKYTKSVPTTMPKSECSAPIVACMEYGFLKWGSMTRTSRGGSTEKFESDRAAG